MTPQRIGVRLAILVTGLLSTVLFTGCASRQTDTFEAQPKVEGAPAPEMTAPFGQPKQISETFRAQPTKGRPREGGAPRSSGPSWTAPANRQDLRIHFIQVGQGDATLLELPNGTNILVDAGSLKERDPDAIKTYLNDVLGSKDIGTLVITHPHADHYNLLPYAVSDREIGQVIFTGRTDEYTARANVDTASLMRAKGFEKWLDDRAAEGLLTALSQDDIDDVDNPSTDLFDSGDVDIWVLAAEIKDGNDKNSRSVVLLVSYGDFDLMLTGDATFATENSILSRYDKDWLDVECLKLGHHGSGRTSTSQNWIDATLPEVAVASASLGPKHGHPNQSIRRRVEAKTLSAESHRIKWWQDEMTGFVIPDYKEAVYSTATNGTIVLTTNGSTFTVTYSTE